MIAPTVQQVKRGWPAIAEAVFVPHSEQEYQQLGALLDALIDEVGEDEAHPLASLMEIVGVLIERFEDQTERCLSEGRTAAQPLRSLVMSCETVTRQLSDECEEGAAAR